jgi:hypothetical protein
MARPGRSGVALGASAEDTATSSLQGGLLGFISQAVDQRYALRADYRRLIARIKEYRNWAKVQYSMFIVKTDSTCVQVRDDLDRFLDASDRSYVGEHTANAVWRNVICTDVWHADQPVASEPRPSSRTGSLRRAARLARRA